MNEPEASTSGAEYGDTWVYEGIVGALPGINLDQRLALGVQFAGFEAGVLALAWLYDLPQAAVAGTVAVLVATVGSAAMVHIANLVRSDGMPEAYQKFLFASNIEVVLTVFAYAALLTHLFVLDGRLGGEPLLESLLGEEPPVAAVYLVLVILWDVCYRIGAAWWASVAALWRSVRFRFDAPTRGSLRRADYATVGFGLLQLAFVPLLLDRPLLLVALLGHVAAVLVVTASALVLLRTREESPSLHP